MKSEESRRSLRKGEEEPLLFEGMVDKIKTKEKENPPDKTFDEEDVWGEHEVTDSPEKSPEYEKKEELRTPSTSRTKKLGETDDGFFDIPQCLR